MTTPAGIRGWRARVYYGAGARADIGVWRDRPVGPHRRGGYQVAFAPDLFAALIPWLALNRRGLSVVAHPETGEVMADHTERAVWLGASTDLNLEALDRVVREAR